MKRLLRIRSVSDVSWNVDIEYISLSEAMQKMIEYLKERIQQTYELIPKDATWALTWKGERRKVNLCEFLQSSISKKKTSEAIEDLGIPVSAFS